MQVLKMPQLITIPAQLPSAPLQQVTPLNTNFSPAMPPVAMQPQPAIQPYNNALATYSAPQFTSPQIMPFNPAVQYNAAPLNNSRPVLPLSAGINNIPPLQAPLSADTISWQAPTPQATMSIPLPPPPTSVPQGVTINTPTVSSINPNNTISTATGIEPPITSAKVIPVPATQETPAASQQAVTISNILEQLMTKYPQMKDVVTQDRLKQIEAGIKSPDTALSDILMQTIGKPMKQQLESRNPVTRWSAKFALKQLERVVKRLSVIPGPMREGLNDFLAELKATPVASKSKYKATKKAQQLAKASKAHKEDSAKRQSHVQYIDNSELLQQLGLA